MTVTNSLWICIACGNCCHYFFHICAVECWLLCIIVVCYAQHMPDERVYMVKVNLLFLLLPQSASVTIMPLITCYTQWTLHWKLNTASVNEWVAVWLHGNRGDHVKLATTEIGHHSQLYLLSMHCQCLMHLHALRPTQPPTLSGTTNEYQPWDSGSSPWLGR